MKEGKQKLLSVLYAQRDNPDFIAKPGEPTHLL